MLLLNYNIVSERQSMLHTMELYQIADVRLVFQLKLRDVSNYMLYIFEFCRRFLIFLNKGFHQIYSNDFADFFSKHSCISPEIKSNYKS